MRLVSRNRMSEVGKFRKECTCQQDLVKGKQNRKSQPTEVQTLCGLSDSHSGSEGSRVQWEFGQKGCFPKADRNPPVALATAPPPPYGSGRVERKTVHSQSRQ